MIYLCEWAGEVDLALGDGDVLVEFLYALCGILVG